MAARLLIFAKSFGGRVLTELQTWFDIPGDAGYFLPDDALGALRDKFRLMRAHGVDACWHIDPEQRTAEVFDGMADGSLLAAGGQLTSPFLPGFALPLAELWAAID